MDNSLLISKYFQKILEESNEILDILYPEDAPHGQQEPVEQEEQEQEQEQEQEEDVQTLEVDDTEPEPEPTPEPEPLNPKDNKIFPLLQPANLTFPFIVHARTGITVNYTKDMSFQMGWYNIVNYTISCVSDDYVQCIELANAVRHAVETYRYKDEYIRIQPIQLLTVAEYTTDNDAFVEELQFQCIVE